MSECSLPGTSAAGETSSICRRDSLVDGGRAQRFTVEYNGHHLAAFAISYQGNVHAYQNQCPHRGTELDWQAGVVFDEVGQFLVCATHGAAFRADTGVCVSGPCHAQRLRRIDVEIHDGAVVLPHHQGRLVTC